MSDDQKASDEPKIGSTPPEAVASTSANDDDEDSTGPKINVIVKTAKDKETVEVGERSTVKEVFKRSGRKFLLIIYDDVLQLKEAVAARFQTDLECVCLIFAGKILKDFETLEFHSMYSICKLSTNGILLLDRN